MQSELTVLEERKQRLEASLAAAKKARDEADGKMQSRYDTQKEDAAQEVAMYEAMITDLKKLMEQLRLLDMTPRKDTVELGSQVTIEFDDGEQQVFLLLDSHGGVDIGRYQTLSTASPVGKAVLGARLNEIVPIRLTSGKIAVKIIDIA